MLKQAIKPYTGHILTWTILYLFPYIIFLYEPSKLQKLDFAFFKTHTTNMIVWAIIFYSHLLYIGPKLFFSTKRWKYFGVLLLGGLTYAGVNYLISLMGPPHPVKVGTLDFLFARIIGPLFFYTVCILASTMLFLYNEQARQKELYKQMELEKTVAELNMLKLQISPHFLFNTLNNIRWLVRKSHPNSEDTIIKLSEILRYIIYEVSDSNVDINKEIEHLRNYIELQALRLPIEGKVEFQVSPSIKPYSVSPLLFIHFVENAFKYGIDSKNSPEIIFTLQNTEHGILFLSKNKVLLNKTTLNTEGIGLSNIKRRLELLYPHKYNLEINNQEGYFEVKLELILDEN